MASLSASRTVISFWPDAYPLLAIDGVAAAARNAGRKAGAGRVDAIRREAGRRSLEAAIVGSVRVCGRRRSGEGWPWGRVMAAEAAGGCWGCWTISSEVGDANRWALNTLSHQSFGWVPARIARTPDALHQLSTPSGPRIGSHAGSHAGPHVSSAALGHSNSPEHCRIKDITFHSLITMSRYHDLP